MNIVEILLIGIGLSMDAFAVSICKGLSLKKITWKHVLIVAGYFGGFQALMPLIGYVLGVGFQGVIQNFDHWIAFGLLSIIGVNMIKEALDDCDEEKADSSLACKAMIVLAIATSIDALVVGVTFAFLNVEILSAVTVIGITTFLISMAGIKMGNIFGAKYKSKAELAGGIILILMGIKILIEHLM